MLPEDVSFSTWLASVRDLVARLDATADGMQGNADALFAVWLAIEGAPSQVRDLFRGFDESELERSAVDLDFQALAFEVGSDTAIEALGSVLKSLAVRLRTLEKRLISLGPQSTRRPHSLIAASGQDEAYVLLRAAACRRPKTAQAFSCRGLVATRLIPRRLGNIDIRLAFAEDFLGLARLREAKPLLLGAGLFPELETVEIEVEGGIAVTDALAPDQVATIRRHLAAATDADCAVVVYPELSIADATLDELKRGLSGAWPPAGISLIVAGSRHAIDEQGRRYNVATVLDVYGGVLAEHRKLFRYLDGRGHDEAIEVGGAIDVVVTAEAIFAVAICLDFCNRTENPPYLRLDVDYVLVPSLGNERTMRSHVQRSDDVLLRTGARSAIVQQFYEPEPKYPVGYAYVRTTSEDPDSAQLRMDVDWRILPL